MSRISVGRCDLCGDHNASTAPIDDQNVCRVCNPENWQLASDKQKDAWLRGELDEKRVWNNAGHSQR